MKRITLAVGLAALVIASTAAFGASAFTSATVERSPNINVAADDAGPIALDDGGTGISKIGSDGELQISVSQLGGVSGVNPNATYTFGDSAAINETTTSSVSTNDYVFNITNNDDQSHDVTVEFTSNNGLSADNVQFTLVKADGGSSGGMKTVKVGSDNSKTITVSSGGTWFVVTTFNTGLNGANDITNSSSLSGTLKVTV